MDWGGRGVRRLVATIRIPAITLREPLTGTGSLVPDSKGDRAIPARTAARNSRSSPQETGSEKGGLVALGVKAVAQDAAGTGRLRGRLRISARSASMVPYTIQPENSTSLRK